MSAATLTDRAPALTAAPPLVHRYLVPFWREAAQPGDTALCGFVKNTPPSRHSDGSASCVVCLALTPKGPA